MILTTIEAEQEMQQLSSLFDTDKQLQQAQVAVEGKRRRRRKKAKDAGEGKKRRLTDKQVQFLEMSFVKERKLESGRKDRLAAELGLDPKQVAVWFQNRRARWKNKQLEGEFMKLKTAYDTTVVDKCHLENEVLRLKGRLLEAEEEIRKLTGGEKSSGSPSSFVSTGNDDCLTFFGELGIEGEAELMYMQDYNYINYMMDLGNLYGM